MNWQMRSVREFIAEWFKDWWGLMGCAAFTFLGIYATFANKSNAWVLGASATAGMVMYFVASFQAWKRQHDVREDLQERTSRLEAAVFGGDPVLVPSTIRIQPRVSFAQQPSSHKFFLYLIVGHLPTTTSEVHLEFTWPYAHIFADITDAKWPDTLEARSNARPIDWQRSGLYGCAVKLLYAPTENSHLRLSVYSAEIIAVRSVRALF